MHDFGDMFTNYTCAAFMTSLLYWQVNEGVQHASGSPIVVER
jgi:hypothetical protein